MDFGLELGMLGHPTRALCVLNCNGFKVGDTNAYVGVHIC